MSKKESKKAALRGGRLEKGLKRISVSLILGANICTTLLLWLCVALTFVSPDVIPRLSLLTLAFPVFLVVEVLFVLFWLIFYARLAWVPVVGLLVVGGYILDYSPMRLAGDTDGIDSTLTVISYNVGGMSDKEKRTELLDYLRTADADIVCLQEVSTHFLKNHQKWLDSTSYHTLQAGNLAFLSHHPFLSDTIRISFTSETAGLTAVKAGSDNPTQAPTTAPGPTTPSPTQGGGTNPTTAPQPTQSGGSDGKTYVYCENEAGWSSVTAYYRVHVEQYFRQQQGLAGRRND